MADTKISGLPAVTDVLGGDEFVLARAGTTKKVAGSAVRASLGVPVPMPTSFAGSADCDFNGSLGPWTAVAGSSGTISLVETTTTIARYDLTSIPGWLLVQVGHGTLVEFRCDYTLADGESIVVPVYFASQTAGDNAAYALRLNLSDVSSLTTPYIAMMVEQDTTSLQAQGNSDADGTGVTVGPNLHLGQLLFLRIARIGTTYAMFVSQNGIAWHYVFRRTAVASPYVNIWLSFAGPSSGSTYMTTVAVPWTKIVPATALGLGA